MTLLYRTSPWAGWNSNPRCIITGFTVRRLRPLGHLPRVLLLFSETLLPCSERELNSRPMSFQLIALPLSYPNRDLCHTRLSALEDSNLCYSVPNRRCYQATPRTDCPGFPKDTKIIEQTNRGTVPLPAREWRNSNPRGKYPPVFETGAFVHSATLPAQGTGGLKNRPGEKSLVFFSPYLRATGSTEAKTPKI